MRICLLWRTETSFWWSSSWLVFPHTRASLTLSADRISCRVSVTFESSDASQVGFFSITCRYFPYSPFSSYLLPPAGFFRVVPHCEELAGCRLEPEEPKLIETKDLACRFQHIQGSAHTDVHARIQNDKSFLKNWFLSCASLLLYAIIVPSKVENHMQINITAHKQFLIFLTKWNCVENIKILKSFPEWSCFYFFFLFNKTSNIFHQAAVTHF